MSVRLSVICRYILSKRLNIMSSFFHRRVATPFYFSPHQTVWQYFDSNPPPLRWRRMQRRKKKSWFSANISRYLGNDTRHNYTYNGRPIASRIWCPWVISNRYFTVTPLFRAEYLGTQYRHNYNENWHGLTPYSTAFRVTLNDSARSFCDSWASCQNITFTKLATDA